MKHQEKKSANIFRRSPFARTVLYVSILAVIFCLTVLIGKTTRHKPEIYSVTPQIASPGETIIIKGSNFGSSKGTSYVEISGSKITGSFFKYWHNNEISLVIPDETKDGLLFVGTSAGKSQPAFFANGKGIPVALRSDPLVTIPVINSITESAAAGNEIIIKGKNFGSTRGNSKVYFLANRDDVNPEQTNSSSIENFIAANEDDFDYIFWSDDEIHVYVPDGAASGSVFVKTDKGTSGSRHITIKTDTGKKVYSNKRTYVVQVTADISNTSADQDSFITLYMPRPQTSSMQPSATLNEYFPEPLIKNDSKNIIYQKSLNTIINNKQRFSQSYVVSVYSFKNNIVPKNIAPYKDKKRFLYTTCTNADSCVPSSNEAVTELAGEIIGKEKNPYNQAKLIYNYMIEHFQLEKRVRSGNISVLDLIAKKSGDAYDFTIVYAALCRASGIPAIPMGGILVENNSTAVSHWWCEIYFENYGWFPVDIALGKGLSFNAFTPVENPKEYYFGNLDSQHIAFSRGWNQIKTSLLNTKTVYRPRTYALQSIWEESSNSTSSYSSLWNTPAIIGIY